MKTINNELVIGNPNIENKIIGSLTVSNGIFIAQTTSDSFLTKVFSTNMFFDLSEGMFYYVSSTLKINSNLTFINIPDTIQSTYVFTFFSDSKFNITSTSINIISNSKNYNCPIYGTISPPTTFSYFLQQLMIINTSNLINPNFICFNSVSFY